MTHEERELVAAALSDLIALVRIIDEKIPIGAEGIVRQWEYMHAPLISKLTSDDRPRAMGFIDTTKGKHE